MTTLEAIQQIAEKDTLIGQLAWKAIDNDNLEPFIQYIKDQFKIGCGSILSALYGYEVIDTIIKTEL
jgi:hypothetical protein